TSRSGMLQKCCPAKAITSSTSGRASDPPSTVIVPCPLITVVTPSSSYTFPVEPKPVTFGALAAGTADAANRLRAPDIAPVTAPAIKPRLLTKLRRVDFKFSMSLFSLARARRLLLDHCGRAVNFYQRISGQRGDRNGRASWTAVRKVIL